MMEASGAGAARLGFEVAAVAPGWVRDISLAGVGMVVQRLVLSEHTVHRHLANILRKLNLSSRAAAAAWGVRTGLV